ncbi:MAG: hypothetical protein IJ987_01320 [Firmicutes bacterium]|nr:hypothetical protein [Bacillota bacterium]
MKAIVKNKTLSRMLAVILTVILVLCCFTTTANASCPGSSTRHLGSGEGYQVPTYDFTVTGYVKYHSLTTTYMDIHSMMANIRNDGPGFLDTWEVIFDGGNGANYFKCDFGFSSDLYKGESAIVEASAHSYLSSTVLQKPAYNGGTAFAFIGGGTPSHCAGWNCYWPYGNTIWDTVFAA